MAFFAVLIIYLIATLLYCLRLIFDAPRLSAVALRVTMVAAVVQFFVLGYHFLNLPTPFVFSYLESLQLSALLLAAMFVSLCFAKRFYGSGPFFIVLIDVFCIYSLSLENPHVLLSNQPGSGYLMFHLVSIFLSLSVFSVALVVAVMFLLSERQIKLKHFGGVVSKFPPLAVLDEIHYKALFTGFLLFSFSIVTGAGYSKVVSGHYLSHDIKQIVSLLCWIFFAIILNFRAQKGWQGHKGILLSLIGFTGMVFLFIVGVG